MILGVGIDLLHNSRVEQELRRGEWLLNDGIFTAEEIVRCNSAKKQALHYAACFAAKEATLKALGVAADDLAMFREVEVELAKNKAHTVVLSHRLKQAAEQRGVERIHLSIAQSARQTGAIVILEK